jgi:hypothetical protein
MDVLAQPEVQDNGDFTMTAIWDFTDDSDFNSYNTSIKDGAVNLTLPTLFWNQSSQSEFDAGIHSSTNSTPAGDLILAEEKKDVNILKNGDFISNQNWTFNSGDNIISSYNGTSQSAEIGYVYKTGANKVFLFPQKSEDDGFVAYWLSFLSYSFDNSSDLTDIGFHDGSFLWSKRSYFYYDLSVIPTSAVVDNVTFYAWLEKDSDHPNHQIDIHVMDNPLSGADEESVYLDCADGNLYVNDSKALIQGSPQGFYEWNLSAQAAIDVQNNLTRGWFGIGIHEEGDNENYARLSTIDAASNHPQLNVSYDTTAPVTFNEIAYVNQTFYKPNVTPSDPTAAQLNFDFKVDKFLGTTADLIVEIDGTQVWGPYSISSQTGWTPISIDVGQYMTASKDYEISLQLQMDVSGMTNVECVVKYDNLNLTTLGYAWSGTFISDIFDAGTDVFWNQISWNYSASPETELKIKSRNSPDGSSWDPWSSEYSISSGDVISPVLGQKIRYSAELTTTNYTKTPKLHDISISYIRYSENGTVDMNNDYQPSNLRNWGTLNWSHQTNGQTLPYWYSTDSGSTWNQTLDGNLTGVSTASGKIRFKTEFITGNGLISPTLYEWNLTFEISELPTLSGGVSPSVGLITTSYNFTVRYSDPENDQPDNITINITEGMSHLGIFDMIEQNVSDTDYTDGKWYYFNDTGFLRGSNYTFHFAAKDPSGVWSVGNDVNGPYVLNSPPKITTDNILGAQGDVLYYNDYEADDLEDQVDLLWSLSTNATLWLTIDQFTGNLSGTPPSGDRGTYWVNVRVSDGAGGFDESNFTLFVGDTQPPVADAGEDQVVYEDEVVQFNGSNSTDNIGISNYTWNFGNSEGYGALTTNIFTKEGGYVVALTVKDILENEDIDLVYITVINHAPVADAGPDITLNEGELAYFNASNSYDTPSDNDSLIYVWDFDEDGEFDDAVGINVSNIWFEPKSISVKLRIIDDDGNFSEDTVSVQINNIVPIVEINEYYTKEKGTELIIVARADHPGNTPILYRWDWENDGTWDTNFTSDFVINHTWDEEGLYTMVVQVTDGVSYVFDSATVEITRHNNPPELADLGIRKIRYDVPFPIDLGQFITDEDNLLSDMTITTDDNKHISINGVEISLIYPQSMVGQTVDVLVTVDDGIASDSSILIVQITQNFPPTLIKPFPEIVFNEDEELLNVFNLNDHIKDNDTRDILIFSTISSDMDPNLIVEIHDNGFVSFKTTPNWAASTFVWFHAEDPSGAFTEERVFVTVTSINDEPLILKQIPSAFTTIGENGNWTIDLDDYFFDVDNFNVTFSCNYPEIKIDPITHEATWVPGDKKQLNGVRFTATDGEHSVSLEPVDLKVVEEGSLILYILIAIVIWIALILVYREIRYRYNIEEVFLVDNAGVLLVHMSRGESKTIDAKLVSGMLTAVQEFVKDSFRGANGTQDISIDEGALGKLEYGDFQIVLERGSYTFLSAVISGYDNKRLRNRMKNVIDKFESKYSHVLADWDGDMAKFQGAAKIVGSLFKNHEDMKVTTESAIEETVSENQEEMQEIDVTELPSGDFGDVPSYYEENSGGEFDEKEGSD